MAKATIDPRGHAWEPMAKVHPGKLRRVYLRAPRGDRPPGDSCPCHEQEPDRGAALGLGCAPAPVAAQAPGAAPDTAAAQVVAAQTVEIAGHYDNGIGTSDAASQGVVRGERLADLPLLRPGEVLETIPGLVVTQHSGDGKANQYFLRGYNLDHGTDFATWVDGLPVNMPTNAHGQGYTDLNFLIPELVEKIDYRKGPYFARGRRFRVGGLGAHPVPRRLDHGILDLAAGSDGYRRGWCWPARTGARPAARALLGALEVQHDNGPWATPEGVRKVNGVVKRERRRRAARLVGRRRWTTPTTGRRPTRCRWR